MPDQGKITLTVPRDPVADEIVKLSITVGTLPPGARIVVRSGRGEVLGAVTPFGRASNRPGITYAIPVATEEILKRQLVLSFTLEEANEKKVRVPTDTEVREIKLLLGP